MQMKPLRTNSHIHSPYSFSAFESIEQAVWLARQQGVAALGLNDFHTTEGHGELRGHCARHGVYPLHNMETIALVGEDRRRGYHYNDANPGRMYICGEALDYPASFSQHSLDILQRVREGTQQRMREMIARVNAHLKARGFSLAVTYDSIRDRYARNTVRERHVAKAIFYAFTETFRDPREASTNLAAALGAGAIAIDTAAKAQGIIRNSLLKAGAPCFVEERDSVFMTPEAARALILDGGGVPCYPVWIDDAVGLTEYEKTPDTLADMLTERGFHCIEFIPHRNTYEIFRTYVLAMQRRGFICVFGTEHNTPEMMPLYPQARDHAKLDQEVLGIGYRGACVLAAHQEARREGRDGFVDERGKRLVSAQAMDALVAAGDRLIRAAAA